MNFGIKVAYWTIIIYNNFIKKNITFLLHGLEKNFMSLYNDCQVKIFNFLGQFLSWSYRMQRYTNYFKNGLFGSYLIE